MVFSDAECQMILYSVKPHCIEVIGQMTYFKKSSIVHLIAIKTRYETLQLKKAITRTQFFITSQSKEYIF